MSKLMQTIDNRITVNKFEEELAVLHAGSQLQRKRGIILLEAQYPDITIGFAVTKLKPAPIAFAARFNFDNYDLEPISVRLVDPFTGEVLPQLTHPFFRMLPNTTQLQPLLQKDDNGLPFLCFPGIREYHEHPAHTGNHWLLHRKKGGEGTLGFLIEKIYEYGIAGISAYHLQININAGTLQLAFDQNQFPT